MPYKYGINRILFQTSKLLLKWIFLIRLNAFADGKLCEKRRIEIFTTGFNYNSFFSK